jgi:hypothetical protein
MILEICKKSVLSKCERDVREDMKLFKGEKLLQRISIKNL